MLAKRELKDTFLQKLKPAAPGKRIIHYDAAVRGFGIRVTDKSRDDDKGTFVLVARYPGSSNPTARRIGDYPAMTLAKARETARQWREDLSRGDDPRLKEEDRRRAEKRARADTFAAVFNAYADDHLSTLRTGADVISAVRRNVMPAWGEKPLKAIRRVDVMELIRTLKKDAPIATNRILAYLKTFFAWAVDQDLLEVSPAANVKRPAKEQKRDRILSELEIRAVWNACGELGIFGRAYRLMLSTGQRRSEVGAMTWAEIDAKERVWVLGRERTKADRGHTVPLSNVAWSLLEECPRLNQYVFSSGRDATRRQDCGATPISGWSKSKSRLDELALIDGKPLPEWRLHDLRRTCATYLAKLGTDRIVISKILNHAEGGVTGVYDRFRYEREKKNALDQWSEHLLAIAHDTEPSNVVSLRALR